jgi:hypothetical protein
MISLNSNMSSIHRLGLICAGALFLANRAMAANPADAQEFARQFIVPQAHFGSSVDSNQRLSGHVYADPQEQARQMIVGVPKFGNVVDSKVSVAASASARNSHIHRDAQESVRRMLLGQGA